MVGGTGDRGVLWKLTPPFFSQSSTTPSSLFTKGAETIPMSEWLILMVNVGKYTIHGLYATGTLDVHQGCHHPPKKRNNSMICTVTTHTQKQLLVQYISG